MKSHADSFVACIKHRDARSELVHLRLCMHRMYLATLFSLLKRLYRGQIFWLESMFMSLWTEMIRYDCYKNHGHLETRGPSSLACMAASLADANITQYTVCDTCTHCCDCRGHKYPSDC